MVGALDTHPYVYRNGYAFSYFFLELVSFHCDECNLFALLPDDPEKNARTSYFSLPGLDVSIGFPQATPASVFPPCCKNDGYFA